MGAGAGRPIFLGLKGAAEDGTIVMVAAGRSGMWAAALTLAGTVVLVHAGSSGGGRDKSGAFIASRSSMMSWDIVLPYMVRPGIEKTLQPGIGGGGEGRGATTDCVARALAGTGGR